MIRIAVDEIEGSGAKAHPPAHVALAVGPPCEPDVGAAAHEDWILVNLDGG